MNLTPPVARLSPLSLPPAKEQAMQQMPPKVKRHNIFVIKQMVGG